MTKIIAMQDIRTSLADIADQVEKGEHYIVVRNSKPAFQLVPLDYVTESTKRPRLSLKEMRARFETHPVNSSDMTAAEIDAIIHEVHEDRH